MRKTKHQFGFSLIEIMVALLLSVFLVGGVLAFFSASNASSRIQSGMSRVLENGRYASQVMMDDLRLTGAQYCSGFYNAVQSKGGLNYARPILVNGLGSAKPSWIPPLRGDPTPVPTTPYPIDTAYFMQGHECDSAGACVPDLPDSDRDINVVPDAGVAVGERAKKTDVLTVRYLKDKGAPLAVEFSRPTPGNGSRIESSISTNAEPLEFESGDDIGMIADCGAAELFTTNATGNFLSHRQSDNLIGPAVKTFRPSGAARVFNFKKDFVSVTYYIGIKTDRLDPTKKTSALYRIVNGAQPHEEVIEGVERMDFVYSILATKSGTHTDRRSYFLTANQVENNTLNLDCPPIAVKSDFLRKKTSGCLWRAVQSVEVSILVNSSDANTQAGESYVYSPDGSTRQTHGATDLLPSGLPAGAKLRREFTQIANLHNFNR